MATGSREILSSTLERVPLAVHEQRRAASAEAAKAEGAYWDAMLANRPSFTGKIAAPPPRERVGKRFGGGTRSATSSYDWYYGLSVKEQARLRRNWFSGERATKGTGGAKRGPRAAFTGKGGTAPDEVEEMGLPIREWLALTRGIDNARAARRGRAPLIDARDYHGHARTSSISYSTRPGAREVDRSERVQFRTAPDGTVYPLTPAKGDTKHHVNIYGQRVKTPKVDHGADEAF